MDPARVSSARESAVSASAGTPRGPLTPMLTTNHGDPPQGEIEGQKYALKRLVERSEKYLSVYDNARRPSAPTRVDRLLIRVGLSRRATMRRMRRMERYLDRIDADREEAAAALQSAIDLAEHSRAEAARHNTHAVGTILKLQHQFKLQQQKAAAVIAQCGDTISLVERSLGVPLPENRREWPSLNFDPTHANPDIPIEKCVRHQEEWKAIVTALQAEASLAEELRVSEAVRRLSSLFDQLSSRFISHARGELSLLGRRFESLRIAITLRELSTLEHFFTHKVGGSSLDDWRSDVRRIEQRADELE